ncbi:hypothetical protein Taro_041227 [Colocasia esculenta]|uniref:Uncharacterized protein n=1 Tax=Colocasia esculenta TaxID=4460 RepID=A0A843WSU6_COLES|nr:hypothetical protein [Colocasia esculenta]
MIAAIKTTISVILHTSYSHDLALISGTVSEIGGLIQLTHSVSPPSPLSGLCRSGREQLRTSAKRASKGFIGLVVSAPSGEERLNGHLGWSRAISDLEKNVDVVFLNEVALALHELKDDVRRDLKACRFGTLHELKDDIRHDLKVGCPRGRPPPDRDLISSDTTDLINSATDLISSAKELISSDIADLMTNRLMRVKSGGREQLRTSAKRASKGFISLVVSAPSGEERLNGHLGWSRAMLL